MPSVYAVDSPRLVRKYYYAGGLFMKTEFEFEFRGGSEAVTVAVKCGPSVSNKISQKGWFMGELAR